MNTDRFEHRCPYLGTPVDTETWFASPSEQNYCHKVKPAQPIAIHYQPDRCLCEEFVHCPIYQQQGVKRTSLPKGMLGKPVVMRKTSPVSGKSIAIVSVIILLLASAVAAIFVLNNSQSRTGQSPQQATLQPQLAITQMPTVSLTETVSTAMEPTNAVQPFVTNTPTVTPTRNAILGIVVFDSNLRVGPSIENAVIVLLKADTRLFIMGRDTFGVWLLVQTETQQLGWSVATQIQGDFEILQLPIASELVVAVSPQPTRTIPPRGTNQITITPSPTIMTYPSYFRIRLSFSPVRDICGENLSDYMRDYDVSITGRYITWNGDSSYWEGAFDSNNGSFSVTGYPASGTDYTTGIITMNGNALFVEGEVRRETRSGQCAPRWTFYGQTNP